MAVCVDEAIATWNTTSSQLELDSVGDFALWYTADTIMAAPNTDIFNHQVPKIDVTTNTDRGQLVHINMVWDLCVADWKDQTETAARPSVAEKEPDEDAPWPE